MLKAHLSLKSGKSNLLHMNARSWQHSRTIKSSSFRGTSREEAFKSIRTSTSSRYQPEDIKYLAKMRRESEHQKIVCKNGPHCVNHDWDRRSPIVKVCTHLGYCDNHDWRHVDRQTSPFKVICKKGPGCANHNWSGRSPMHRLKPKVKREPILPRVP